MEIITILVIILAYFLPWIIAEHRKHHNRLAISWTNLLIGWTGIGWVFCFIWSLTATGEKK